MDLSTIASLAEAFAVIVAVVFGMVQLRQLNAQQDGAKRPSPSICQSIAQVQVTDGVRVADPRLQSRDSAPDGR